MKIVSSRKSWTKDEDDILIKYFNKEPNSQLLLRIPTRTLPSIKERVKKLRKNQDIPFKNQKYFVGYTINNFTIIERYNHKWKILCHCGNVRTINSNHIKRIKSCGCLQVQRQFKEKPRIDTAIQLKYCHYKNAALRRDLKFNISFDEFKKLIQQNCYYCHLPPHRKQKHYNYPGTEFYFNGVDRVDSGLNYEIDNCVSCCSYCNRAKNDESEEDYRKWLDWVKQNV